MHKTQVDTRLSQIAVIVPTYNAAKYWFALSSGLRMQGLSASQVLVVDSSSADGTPKLAEADGYKVVRIDRRDFNHGGTRQWALGHLPWAKIVVYMTQDAILATPDALLRLVEAFSDTRIGAAYGRQLPRRGAGPIEAHGRLFNYPAVSDVRDLNSRHRLGFRAASLSNSFAAYRVSALEEVGGFPTDIILSEDSVVAARLLMAGWKTSYVSEAQVYHSHAFTVREEFRRYFDIGVFHARTPWLKEQFGGAGGEGKKFVLSEWKHLFPRHSWVLPLAVLRTMTKGVAYQLGLREANLGKTWSRRLSMQPTFWDKDTAARREAAPLSRSEEEALRTTPTSSSVGQLRPRT